MSGCYSESDDDTTSTGDVVSEDWIETAREDAGAEQLLVCSSHSGGSQIVDVQAVFPNGFVVKFVDLIMADGTSKSAEGLVRNGLYRAKMRVEKLRYIADLSDSELHLAVLSQNDNGFDETWQKDILNEFKTRAAVDPMKDTMS